VIHLARVHVGAVVDLSGAVEIDRAVANRRIGIRHVTDHLQRDRIEAILRNDVVGECVRPAPVV
jgi:hypothetical protein